MLHQTTAVVLRLLTHSIQHFVDTQVLMLAMVLVATALTRFTIVHTKATHDGDVNSHLAQRVFSEDDITPFSEQLGNQHENLKKRHDKYDLPHKTKSDDNSRSADVANERLITEILLHVPIASITLSEEEKKRGAHNEEVDIVDREDHVTQYLADLLVNTDSEITSLQASDAEEDRESLEVKEDTFFAFLTGQEKVQEVEGAWSRPIADDERREEYLPNILVDEE